MLRTLQNPCGNRGHIGLQSGCPSGLGARWPSSSRFSRREATDVAPTPPRSSGTRHRMSDGPSLDGLGKSGDRRDGGRPDDSREGPHRPAHRAQCFLPRIRPRSPASRTQTHRTAHRTAHRPAATLRTRRGRLQALPRLPFVEGSSNSGSELPLFNWRRVSRIHSECAIAQYSGTLMRDGQISVLVI